MRIKKKTYTGVLLAIPVHTAQKSQIFGQRCDKKRVLGIDLLTARPHDPSVVVQYSVWTKPPCEKNS